MDETEVNNAELSKLDDFRLVQLLQRVGLGQRRLELAKRDYYHAFAQRSHSVRESLVLDDEVSRFERTLIEERQPRFEQMCDGLEDGCGEPELRKAGLGHYSWVENEARFPFRTLTNRFLSVGSYHILADRLRVGWHRDYATVFAKQLEDADVLVTLEPRMVRAAYRRGQQLQSRFPRTVALQEVAEYFKKTEQPMSVAGLVANLAVG